MLSEQLRSSLEQHLLRLAILYKEDISHGAGLKPMPDALARNYLRLIFLRLAVCFSFCGIAALGRLGETGAVTCVGFNDPASVQASSNLCGDSQACQRVLPTP